MGECTLGNHVGGGVGVGGVVHVEVVEGLQQAVVHGHMLHPVDVEIAVGRPEGIAPAEGMGQIHKNGLTHNKNSFSVLFGLRQEVRLTFYT